MNHLLVCRICLSILKEEYLDISSSYFEEKTLKELMEMISETTVELLENLPPYVCISCSEKLCKFYELRVQIQKTEQNLKEKCLTLVDLGNKTMFCFSDTNLEIDKLMVVPDPMEAADAEENVKEVKLEREDPLTEKSGGGAGAAEGVFYLRHNLDYGEGDDGGGGDAKEEIVVEEQEIVVESQRVPSGLPHLIYSCEICDDKFATKHKLNNHVTIVHSGGQPKFSCDLCGRGFHSVYSLRHHKIRMHTHERPHACEHCDKTFAISYELKKHIKLKHSVNEEEDSDAPMKRLIKKHKFIHNCPYCDKIFNSVTLLDRHKDKKHLFTSTSHQKHTWHVCEVCGRKFSKKTYLSQHMKMHSGIYYKCDECDKTCRLRSQLANHKRKMHFHERPHVCDTCGKGFTTQYELKKHDLCHSSEKRYMCELCSKQFRYPESLFVHRRGHMQKMIPCEVCGKEIKDRYMPKHMQLHDESTVYKCDICDRDFKQSQSLYEHKRIKHLGFTKKRSTCELCGLDLCTNGSYLRHKRIVHMGMRYQCTVCEAAYSERNRAMNHVKRVHPEMQTEDKELIVFTKINAQAEEVAKEEVVSETESVYGE